VYDYVVQFAVLLVHGCPQRERGAQGDPVASKESCPVPQLEQGELGEQKLREWAKRQPAHSTPRSSPHPRITDVCVGRGGVKAHPCAVVCVAPPHGTVPTSRHKTTPAPQRPRLLGMINTIDAC